MSLTPAKKALVRWLVVKKVDERDARSAGKPISQAMSDYVFADALGLHKATIEKWRKLPEVAAAVEAGLREYEETKDYFASCMRFRALQELWINYTKAKDTNRRQYLSMILEQTKDAAQTGEVVDFSDMTDDDLVAAVLGRDLSVLGMTVEELLKARGSDGSPAEVKGATCSKPSPESASEPDCSPPDSTPDGAPETEPVSHRVRVRRPSRTRRSKTR